MRYYIVAGERSGDLHASNLMKSLLNEDEQAEFRFWGGDAMQAVGGTMVKHYRETAFMGIWEVITNLRKIFGFIKECKEDILHYQPDAVILVDYAAFNMRIAKFIKKQGFSFPVYYYISPKVWAWNTQRAYKIKANVDKMFVIFPFEVDFYQGFDYRVDYVGNPLLDAIQAFSPNKQFREENDLPLEKPLIALLPGSRKQEVTKILDKMLIIRKEFPAYHFVIAGVSNLPKEFYEPFARLESVSIIYDQTYDLLSQAEAALVTSGTATLETALFGVPQVVVYKTSALTFWVGKLLIKVPYISLVNLVADKEAVRELIQKDFNPVSLQNELQAILRGGEKRSQILADYAELKSKMGDPGASEKAGKLMWRYLKGKESELMQ